MDVSSLAITDHEHSLHEDVEFLSRSPEVPGHVVVSGLIYDVQHGSIRQVVSPARLASSRRFSTDSSADGYRADGVSAEIPTLGCETD